MSDIDSLRLNESLNYVPLVHEFNGSNAATGGNSLTEDLNIWYQVCVCARGYCCAVCRRLVSWLRTEFALTE
jgi:hypothetical protein